MADLQLRNLDDELIDRIMLIARARSWPIQECVVHLLKQAVGLEPPPDPLPGDIAKLGGAIDSSEDAALKAAIAAFEQLPDDSFY